MPHVGTHGIRHRATTDIANSGVPTKVGMKLTGHKTVAMFMHYVHTKGKQVSDGMIQFGLRGLSAVALETLPHPSAQPHGSVVKTLLQQRPHLPSISEQI